MCLAVPGRVLEIEGDDHLTRTARVDFGGVIKTVNLAFLPECSIGEHVLVHVGVAIGKVDEGEAARMHDWLEELIPTGDQELPE